MGTDGLFEWASGALETGALALVSAPGGGN